MAPMRPAQPRPRRRSPACGLRQAGALVEGEDADAARVDADCADRALADFDAVVEIEWHAKGIHQGRADHVAMADQHDRLVEMALVEFNYRRDDPLLYRAHALAAGY